MYLNIAVLFISKCTLHCFILENLVSFLAGNICVQSLGIAMKTLLFKFANITHYVELVYTYHTTTYLYLHSLGGRTLLLSLHPRRYIYTFTVHPGG